MISYVRISTSSVLGQLAGLAVRTDVEAENRRVGRVGQRDVVLGDAADRSVHERAGRLRHGRGDASASVTASSDPCTSAFRIDVERGLLTGLNLGKQVLELCAGLDSAVFPQMASLETMAASLADGLRDLCVGCRTELVAGFGTSDRPSTWTGVDGPAVLTCSPLSLIIARTLPQAPPATIGSPTLRVPLSMRIVATGPRPLSSCASMTMPLARPSGWPASLQAPQRLEAAQSFRRRPDP